LACPELGEGSKPGRTLDCFAALAMTGFVIASEAKQSMGASTWRGPWIPAFAGMTKNEMGAK